MSVKQELLDSVYAIYRREIGASWEYEVGSRVIPARNWTSPDGTFRLEKVEFMPGPPPTYQRLGVLGVRVVIGQPGEEEMLTVEACLPDDILDGDEYVAVQFLGPIERQAHSLDTIKSIV